MSKRRNRTDNEQIDNSLDEKFKNEAQKGQT